MLCTIMKALAANDDTIDRICILLHFPHRTGGNCVTWTTWKSTIVCQNNKRRVPKERLARISTWGKVFKLNERLGALSGLYGIL